MKSRKVLENLLIELDPQRHVGKTFELSSYGISRTFTIRRIEGGVVEAAQENGVGLQFPLDEFETALSDRIVKPACKTL